MEDTYEVLWEPEERPLTQARVGMRPPKERILLGMYSNPLKQWLCLYLIERKAKAEKLT
jgi:hypothetical protein